MRRRDVVLASALTVVLAGGSVAAVGATGAMHSGSHALRTVTASCRPPSLPGQHVTVVLADMRGRSMMRGAGWMHGRMMLRVAPRSVHAGTVSLLAVNRGSLTHEVVVLPLAPAAIAGGRAVGADGTVDESGSLGEASHGCGPGTGDGIRPGETGWVTLSLAPGRYELVCNLRGHYAAGMYAELDVG